MPTSFIDLRTFLLIIGLLYIILPVLTYLALFKYMNQQIKLWCVGGIFTGVAIVAFSVYQLLDNSIYVVMVANLFFLGHLVRIYALKRELSTSPNLWYYALFFLITLAIYSYITLGLQNIALRTAFMSFISMLLYGTIAWTAYQIGRTNRSFNAYVIAAVYGLVIMTMLLRLINILSAQKGINLFESDLSQIVIVISVLVSAVVSHLSYIGLMLDKNYKRENEALISRAHQEKSDALRQQLSELDKQRSVGIIALSLRHEVNQPLHAIQLGTEIISKGIEEHKLSPQQQIDVLASIHHNVSRITGLINTFSQHIEPSTPAFIRHDLYSTIEQSQQLLLPFAKRYHVTILCHHQATQLPVKGDPISLSQVIVNVLKNAIEASAEQHAQQVEVRTHADSHYAYIEIEDQGKGFDTSRLNTLGQSIASTKAVGMGIGLCIAHNILEEHDGYLRFDNAVSGGACVTIQIPLSPNDE